MARNVRAGGAYVELLLKDGAFQKALKRVTGKMKQMGGELRAFGGSMAAVGAAITGPIILATKTFMEFGDSVQKASLRAGISAEAMSELKYAAERAGAEMSDVEAAFRGMARTMDDAKMGLKTSVDAYDKLGLKVADLERKNPEERFLLIADALSRIQDPTQRAASAMEIFGKSGTKLMPMLADGAVGIEKLRARAQELGLTMSQEDADAAAKLTDIFADLKDSLRGVALQIGSAVAPTLQEFATRAIDAVKTVVSWIKNNQELVVSALKTGAAITAIGTAIMGAGALLSALGTIAAAVFSPMGIAIIGVTAAMAALVALFGDLEGTLSDIEGMVDSFRIKAEIDARWEQHQRKKQQKKEDDAKAAGRMAGSAIADIIAQDQESERRKKVIEQRAKATQMRDDAIWRAQERIWKEKDKIAAAEQERLKSERLQAGVDKVARNVDAAKSIAGARLGNIPGFIAQAMAAQNAREGVDIASRNLSQGTFSASGASILGMQAISADPTAERTMKATEEIAKNTSRLVARAEKDAANADEGGTWQ